MKPEDFDEALHLWGKVFGERKPNEWAEDSSPTGNSPLAAFVRSEPDRRRKHHDIAARDGRARRRSLGAVAGLATGTGYVLAVPMWACDPIPCSETRARQSSPPPDPRLTPIVDSIQSAWLALHGFYPLQAEVVRVQYQVRAMTREEKAALVGEKVGDLIAPRRYKDALKDGKLWIHARITA